MPEAFSQALDNLRANKLRSFLTMFGILWGIIAVVVLAATGEGFQRGNQTVLEELGKNIAIVWGGRTSMQAGGERAGRRVFLTVEDARAIERDASLVAVAERLGLDRIVTLDRTDFSIYRLNDRKPFVIVGP